MGQAVYGLIGWPVGHSASPAMMNAAFQEMGEPAVYGLFPVQPSRIEAAMAGLAALSIRGVNVTIPHKQAVLPWLSDVSDEARFAGAVNTISVDADSGRMSGHNTDVSGWWKSVSDAQKTPWEAAIVLGAGGAARAIAAALALYSPATRLRIAARNVQKAEEIASGFRDKIAIEAVPWEKRCAAIEQAELVVQATPVGMWPRDGESPVENAGCFHSGQVVQDIVYRPLETAFLKLAASQGAKTLDGLNMLVHQGAAAIQFWMKRQAPVEVMRTQALAAVGGTPAH